MSIQRLKKFLKKNSELLIWSALVWTSLRPGLNSPYDEWITVGVIIGWSSLIVYQLYTLYQKMKTPKNMEAI